MLKTLSVENKKSRIHPDNNSHDEYQYLNLLSDVIEHGFDEVGRNGQVKCVVSARFYLDILYHNENMGIL